LPKKKLTDPRGFMLSVILITDRSSKKKRDIEEVIKANSGLSLVAIMIQDHGKGQHWGDQPFARIAELAPDILWTDLDGVCTGCGLSTLRVSRFEQFKQWSSYCGSEAEALKFAFAMGAECFDSSSPEILQAEVAGALQRMKARK
jgi:hypothetical protein